VKIKKKMCKHYNREFQVEPPDPASLRQSLC